MSDRAKLIMFLAHLLTHPVEFAALLAGERTSAEVVDEYMRSTFATPSAPVPSEGTAKPMEVPK